MDILVDGVAIIICLAYVKHTYLVAESKIRVVTHYMIGDNEVALAVAAIDEVI
jgi:hypothetical protein